MPRFLDMARHLMEHVPSTSWWDRVILATSDDAALRRCACECARLALAQCEEADPRIVEALEVGERAAAGEVSGSELAAAHAEMSSRYDEAAQREEQARLRQVESVDCSIEWCRASSFALACAAAAAALDEDARHAAQSAAYDAYWSLARPREMTELGRIVQRLKGTQ